MRFLVLNFQSSETFRPSGSGKYDFAKKYRSIRDLSSSLIGESLLDSSSEKEQVLSLLQALFLLCDILVMQSFSWTSLGIQGNEFFKQKKFNEAIDCYSRSIALSPNAVTYANRAMAYLKIKRFAHCLFHWFYSFITVTLVCVHLSSIT